MPKTTVLTLFSYAPSSHVIFVSFWSICSGSLGHCGRLTGHNPASYAHCFNYSLWTLFRYRYITAVAAYLVFIPLEMIAQILAPSRITSADANALPFSNPKLIHYIFGKNQARRYRVVNFSHNAQRLFSGPDYLFSLLFSFSISSKPRKTT